MSGQSRQSVGRANRWRRLIVWMMLGLGLCAPALAGEYAEQVEVRLIELDAVVTDRKGNSIEGLGRDDFEVLIDGTPVEVTNFRPVDGRRRGPHEAAEEPGPESAAGPRLYLLLFIDNTSLELHERNTVLSQVWKLVRQALGSADRVMVVAANRLTLETHLGFSSDRQQIDSALKEVEADLPQGQRRSEFSDILREIERSLSFTRSLNRSASGAQAQLLGRIRAYAGQAYQDTVRTSENLRRFVDAMGGLAGRKAIFYVGGGVSLRPGEALLNAWRGAIGRSTLEEQDKARLANAAGVSSLDASEHVSSLAAHASTHGVELYSVVIAGERAGLSAGASGGTVEANPGGATPGREDAWAPELAFTARVDLEEPLKIMAEETGGVAVISNKRLEQVLARVAAGFDNFYSLAVPAPRQEEGAWHSIEVRARGRGLRVRHRRTYRGLGRDEEAVYRMRSALLAGEGDNRLGARLEVEPPRPGQGGTVVVPVSVEVPMTHLAVIPDGHSHRGQLSIFLAASSGGISAAAVEKTVLPVTIPNEEVLVARGRFVAYSTELRMPLGWTRIAVGVRDDLSGAFATLTAGLAAGRRVGFDPP